MIRWLAARVRRRAAKQYDAVLAEFDDQEEHWPEGIAFSAPEAVIEKIDGIQQDWWEGDVPMNVALSEIREVLGIYKRSQAPPSSVDSGTFPSHREFLDRYTQR